jgi:hypothetical protein
MFPVAEAKDAFAQTLCFAFLRRSLYGNLPQSQDYRFLTGHPNMSIETGIPDEDYSSFLQNLHDIYSFAASSRREAKSATVPMPFSPASAGSREIG